MGNIFLQLAFLMLILLATVYSVTAVDPRAAGLSNLTSLPQHDSDPTARSQAILVKRQGYLYGPSLIGNSSFFISGNLGVARMDADIVQFSIDEDYVNGTVSQDLLLVEGAVGANGGLHSLLDYATVLYNGEWQTSIPGGEDPGILSNYTQDLLFSMERLSLNPYSLYRLRLTDSLPITIADSIVIRIAGVPLAALHFSGRLFVVDHHYQAKYPKTSRYGAACTAYFFIHPSTGDFLPLAIQTNTGSNLVYTPLDTPNDWLLAKIMFNVNDLFHAEIYHLIATHAVGEIVHQAALRTLSEHHPIMALLDRLMKQAYAIRPVGEQVLFNPGGAFDKVFYVNSTGVREFVADFYPIHGAFQGHYLERDLVARGLLNGWGPALSSFPYYEDASTIRNSIGSFMNTFVNSYYTTNADVVGDAEVQAWFHEATTAALVIDFPWPTTLQQIFSGKQILVEILTHFAYLTGVVHHALNTGDPVASLGTLPFHPMALYEPIPTTKGVADLLPFMPPVPQALFQIDLLAAFNRQQYASQNKTLVYAFSDPGFLSQFNSQVGAAVAKFQTEMESLSGVIKGRKFDANGLCQGMPFIWRSLDPGTIPFFFAV